MARKKNYLNNKDLYNELVTSKELDKLTPTAEKMLNTQMHSHTLLRLQKEDMQRDGTRFTRKNIKAHYQLIVSPQEVTVKMVECLTYKCQ